MLSSQHPSQHNPRAADTPARSRRRLAAATAGFIAAGTIAAAAPAFVVPASAASAAAPAVTEASTAAAKLQAWPVLKEGRNSLWPHVTIRSLQYLLTAHGAKLAVDGVFGSKTKTAVVAFQRSRKLPASGVVKARTWRALVVMVKRGSTGPAVRAVQDQINFRNNKNGHTLAVDGVFGRKTEAAVRAFQRAMSAQVPGFAVNGIAGKQTWQALVTEALSG
ncbi:MAG TPA: peptidoglycan-binding protein [Streptosporangiaceae bacterium]|nr:peptidoglycan-binding protein [Streptosporangiaceae bacterium]